MRVMIFAKEGGKGNSAKKPTEEQMKAFGAYHQELHKAGIILAEGRLHPSATAKRIDFSGGKPTVLDGPFAESKELIAGYWLWEVHSMEEALQWLKKAPYPGGEFEIRQVMDMPEMK